MASFSALCQTCRPVLHISSPYSMFEWSKFQPSFQEIRPSAKGFLRKNIDAQVAKCFGAGVEPWLMRNPFPNSARGGTAFKLVGYDYGHYGRHLWLEIPSFIGFYDTIIGSRPRIPNLDTDSTTRYLMLLADEHRRVNWQVSKILFSLVVHGGHKHHLFDGSVTL